MDTSKKYIKMCEKAEEIQGEHVKSETDIFFHKGVIKIIASKLPGMHGKDTFIERVPFDYVSELRPEEWNDYCIWLPRQDQLQNMCLNYKNRFTELLSLLDCFHYWAFNKPYINADTMEQLWIAFIMNEKFNKTWNGTDWVKGEE